MMQGAWRAAAALAKVGQPQPLPLPAEAGLAPMRAAKQASLSPLVVETIKLHGALGRPTKLWLMP